MGTRRQHRLRQRTVARPKHHATAHRPDYEMTKLPGGKSPPSTEEPKPALHLSFTATTTVDPSAPEPGRPLGNRPATPDCGDHEISSSATATTHGPQAGVATGPAASCGGCSRASAAGCRPRRRRTTGCWCWLQNSCAHLTDGDPAAGPLAVVGDEQERDVTDRGARLHEALDAGGGSVTPRGLQGALRGRPSPRTRPHASRCPVRGSAASHSSARSRGGTGPGMPMGTSGCPSDCSPDVGGRCGHVMEKCKDGCVADTDFDVPHPRCRLRRLRVCTPRGSSWA